MFAVIKTGGKQYNVKQGDRVKVEKLNIEVGETVQIADVLLVGDGEHVTVGTPLVAGATVSAKVSAHGLGPKIKIVKFQRRKHHHKRMGHRQAYTELAIESILAG